MIWKGFKAIR